MRCLGAVDGSIDECVWTAPHPFCLKNARLRHSTHPLPISLKINEPTETLPRPRRAALLQRFGRALANARPEGTTRLLMDLCLTPEGSPPPGSDAAFVAAVADFAQLYTERPTALMLLCEFVANRCACMGV